MNVWGRWVERVWATEDATPTALFRIAIGLCTLYTLLSVIGHGLVPVLWEDSAFGGYRKLGEGPWLVAWMGGPTSLVVESLAGSAVVAAALLTAGIGGRVTAVVTLLLVANLTDINGHSGGSYDSLLTNGLWLVALSRSDATLSLSARLRTGSWWPQASVLAFPRWLAVWQLVLMYCTTGLQKVSAYWVPGGDASALYYILQQPEWQRADMSFMAWLFPLTQVATTVTWLWEVAAPVWMLAVWYAAAPARPGAVRAAFNRVHVREWFVVLGIAMHAAIFVTMNVGPFSPLSLAFYVTLYHPTEWERAFERIYGVFRPSSGAPQLRATRG
ncbi:MAG: hypothetical protein ABMA64_21495 [Myxococcota bacterium]